MEPNEIFSKLADDATIAATVEALNKNNITTFVVENGAEANKKLFELLPENAQVMNMSSTTFVQIGADKEIVSNPKYNAVRNLFAKMDKEKQKLEMQQLGAAPEWAIGSVHAVTQKGEVLIASASGSQLPAYAFGSSHVIWIVGTQKIVTDFDEGMKRIYEYCLPLENVRAMKAYGTNSSVNKILTINKESTPGRIIIIFVKEKLGF